MFLKIVENRKKENAFSLLELSVAVGVAAILAVAGIVASTAFIGSAQEKSSDYTANASSSINDAEEQSLALADGFAGGGGNPLLSFAYAGATNGTLSFTRGEASQAFMPNSIYTGASYSLGAGTLPTGVTLNPTTGALTGPADWGFNASRGGGVGTDEIYDLDIASDGSTIIVGVTEETSTFGNNTFTSGMYAKDIIVAKLDAKGDYLWSTAVDGENYMYSWAESVSATSDGGAIVAGRLEGTATFGSTTISSQSGSQDGFIAKINKDGVWQWAKRIGGSQTDVANAVSVAQDGGALVVGSFEGNAEFGDTTLSSFANTSDIFVAKISSNGTWVWATRAGGGSSDGATRVSLASDGGAIVVGYFGPSISFTEEINLSGFSGEDIFVAKISSSGVWQWAEQAGGSGYADNAFGVTVASDGGAIITGVFTDTATFGTNTLTSAGGPDMFVAKVGSSGSWVWAIRFGGSGWDYVGIPGATSDGGAIITGGFSESTVFGDTTLTSAGGQDLFVAKVSSSGSWVWAKRAGGVNGDAAYVAKIATDGGALISGSFSSLSLSFGSASVASTGGYDGFVAKISASGDWSSSALAGSTESVTISVTDGVNSTDYQVNVSTE